MLGFMDRRCHARNVQQPFGLKINGCRCKTRNWSLGGFRIVGNHVEFKVGDRLDGEIGPVGDGGEGTFSAVVAHVTDDGEVGFKAARNNPRGLPRDGGT